MQKHPSALLVLLLSLLFLIGAPPHLLPGQESTEASGNEVQEILLILSYDSLDAWSVSITEGILSILPQEGGVQYHVEYLDTRHSPSPDYLATLHKSILKKHSKLPPSLIICADDAALDFAVDLRKRLDPAPPLFFCGVNNPDPKRWEGAGDVLGVAEQIDIAGTVNSALSLFPETERLAVVSNTSGVGRINLDILYRQYPDFLRPLEILELVDLNSRELAGRLSDLAGDTLVLRLDNVNTKKGQQLCINGSISFLSEASSRPVLSCWDFDMGKGALGGVVVTGFRQGASVGSMVKQFLEGAPLNSLPPILESPNVEMYDYRQLQRFDISLRDVSDGALILNKPDTFFRRYRGPIIASVLLILLLIILVVALTVNLFGRRRAEAALKESEERHRLAMEASNDGLWDWDLEANTLYWSPRAYTMLGYEVDQFPVDFTVWKELIHPEDREETAAIVEQSIREGRGNFALEFRYRNRAGAYQWISGRGKIVAWDSFGKVKRVTGTHVDITHRKETEKQLQQSLREKEVLLRELYHRTKNNMQVVASLLSLRRSTMTNPETTEILRNLETKVFSMGLVHQMLYQSKNLDRIDLGEYIRGICTLTGEAYDAGTAKIAISYSLETMEVGIDTAIPLGLVVNELFTNAVKYAFPGREKGLVTLTLESRENRGRLMISDDGGGMELLEEEMFQGDSLGMPTVKELVENQLDGVISYKSKSGEGTSWFIEFPVDRSESSA